jgi:hypothetical protein
MIIVRGPVYFSPGDEKAFFDWLLSIPCVETVDGEGYDVHIRLKRPPGNSDLRELIAVLFRYRMNMQPLAAFRTTRNMAWFDDRAKFWHSGVFGRPARKMPKSNKRRAA